MRWIAAILLLTALYVASSGLAFVAMHRWPEYFSARAATIVYAPLDWSARRSRTFAKVYDGFHQWCWRAAGHPGQKRAAR
jgi:hypothetical protein